MARTRARRMALAQDRSRVAQEGEAVAEAARVAEELESAPLPAEDSSAAPSKPMRSPPMLMLVVDEEEEIEFCTPDSHAASIAPSAASDALPQVDPELTEADPPFDPPDMEDLLSRDDGEDVEGAAPVADEPEFEEVEFDDPPPLVNGAPDPEQDENGVEQPPVQDVLDLEQIENGEAQTPAQDVLDLEAVADDEEPPFDPIDVEELTPPSLSLAVPNTEELPPAPANENGRGASLGPARNAVPEGAREQPAPAIRIHFSWDRPDAAEFFQRVAADPRLSRAEIMIGRGGLDGAAVQCSAHQRPDLVVIETTLRGRTMLASLDRLMQAAGRETRVIVLGGVNDVTLLRELAQRGVDEYLVWPVAPGDVAGAACAMFAGADKARVIAVVGARGGLGASTLAHNLAWSIAERHRARTTLVDLDLPFGAAAFNFKLEPARSLGDVLDAGEAVNDIALERVAIQRTERLTILPAPATPRRSADIEADAASALVAAARRLSSFVVLDLPHMWEPWVKQALLGADEIVLVSCPDIASLRNTDNIAKLIKNERKTDPLIVVSMAGVPKRPEVPLKEFAEALGIVPECVFAFEPNIFGAAAITGQMLGEIAPDSKAAAQVDQLASLLTGREPVELLQPQARIFAEPLPDEVDAAPQAAAEPADPFEHALVNPFALIDAEQAPDEQEPSAEPVPVALAPLDLLELAPLEPDYIARARAAALEALDAIENPIHPQRRFSLGRFAGLAAGFALTVMAVGAYVFMRLDASPAPASAHAAVEVQTPPAPPPAPTPQQLAAEYESALRLLNEDAAPEAVTRLQRLAEAGFAMAQYRLAKLYESGQGVAPDLVQARQWTERAAAAGNRNAIHDLGVYYARGEGAPRDDASAFRYFQQAAELGLVDSQFNLGVLYDEGRGVEANQGEALFWFMLAAQQGDEAATARVTALRATLTPFEIEQAAARVAAFEPTPSDPIANGVFEPASPPVENAAAPAVPAAPTEG